MEPPRVHLIKPRRSVLYVPGSNARALQKAQNLPCDAVILDLEDAVAPDAKQAARENVRAAIAARPFGRREVIVRINALASSEAKADLEAVRGDGAHPDAILLPKIVYADDVAAARAVIPADMALWAMIETPNAILNLADIAAAGAACLVMGTNDLLKEMRAPAMPDRDNLKTALSLTVMAARAHGLAVLDGTYNRIDDGHGLAAACAQGRALGFDGKTVIHPGQIEACNRIFAPTADELDEARRLIAAFALPENRDKGAIALDGQMVERLHAQNAARLIALADAIQGR